MKNDLQIHPITLDDTNDIVKWRNTSFVKKNLFSQDDLTSEQHIAYYHRSIESGKVVQFVIKIVNDNSSRNIGTTFIKNIDYKNKKAEFGIFIGEQDVLGKGYGGVATKLTVNYAFSNLQLNRVYLSVFADNTPAIKAYEKNGFVYEGKLIQDQLRDDQFVDVIIMGITRDIWNP